MENSLQNTCVSLNTLKKYKRGTLNSKKKAAVATHLSTCQLCDYTASNLQSIDERELEEDLTILKKNITDKLFDSKRQQRQSAGLYRVAAAVAFLVAMGLAIQFFINSNSKENLYATYYKPYEVPATLIRSTTENNPTISPPLAEAIATYTNTPYQKNNTPTSFDQDPNQRALTHLLKGLTALEKGHSKMALPLLEKAEKSKTKFAEDAAWYLALAHLKLEDSSNSVNYLDKILLLGKGFYFEKASALKAQLLE